MASPTKGDGRAKPEWGAPAPGPGAGTRAAPAARGRAAAAKGSKPPAKGAAKGTAKGSAAGTAKGAAGTRTAKGRGVPGRGRARTATADRPSGRGRSTTRPAARGQAGRFRRRYGVVYDTDGPRVRLGVCWFVVALIAITLGPTPTAVAYGVAAAIAGAQMARAWRAGTPQPSELMAAVGAGILAVGACFGAGGAGLALLGCVGLAFVGAAGEDASPNPRIADVGWTLQCALGPGVAAMSMVLLARLDQGSAIGLLLLVSAYEAGDYLIGSGSANPLEGPGAGAAGIVVITFILSTLPISALSFGQAWVLGGLVALLAPAGQLVASGLLPNAGTPASGLRRLDSLLIAAPVWAWGVGLVLR